MFGTNDKQDFGVAVGTFNYDEKSFLGVYSPLDRPTLCIGKISNDLEYSSKIGEP